MRGALVTSNTNVAQASALPDHQEFVTMRLGEQIFGISVMMVQDVLRFQHISPVPHAPEIIEGSLNLRGRIVTAINMRKRLKLGDYPIPKRIMKVVVEYDHELFALMVDSVGDVLMLDMKEMEKTPANMDPVWRSVALGVSKLQQDLLVILDVASLIDGKTGHA